MIKEITATGADVNSAIDAGCLLLGIDRSDVQFEIISLPKKGFLGLKKLPAKVRVYIELPDEPKKQSAPQRPQSAQPAQGRSERPRQNNNQNQNNNSNTNTNSNKPAAQQAAPVQTAPAQAAQSVQGDGASASKKKRDRHKKNKQRAADGAEQTYTQRDGEPRTEIEPTEEIRAKAELARVYVTSILGEMGFKDIEIKPFFYEENVRLQLGGERLGSVIGRRGETLDALQYLASLVANRSDGDYLRINIDSGNYREKRERTLEALARKLAGSVLRSGRSVTLEPMNPYERRIIHGTVSSMKGVTSSSVGTEPNRRVVISADGTIAPTDPEGAERAERGGNDRKGRFGGRGGRGGRGGQSRPTGERTGERTGDRTGGNDRRERTGRRDDPPAIGGPVNHDPLPKPERSEAEKEAAKSTSLYGKIEL